MSKLRSVIRHEYLTIVRQPSFWIVMFAMPAFIAIIFAISYFGNKSSEARINELAKDIKNVAVIDRSGLVNKQVIQQSGLTLAEPSQFESIRSDVQNQKREGLIYYPADLAKTKHYQLYASTNDFTKNGSFTAVADSLLQTSLFLPLGSADIIALAKDGAKTDVISYDNGRETAGINEYIVPGTFIVLFYIIFFFSVGYMLSSVSEEKENRSMEMVLTYVRSRTLIIGKLLAVILVTLTQILFFAALGGVALLIASALGNSFTLPAGIDPSRIVFDPAAIFFGATFLFAGFMMYAGFMTTTAAAAPSSREANSFASVFYIGAFSPGWIFMLLLTDPDNPVTKFATFFPLTSPVAALIRNAVGNISLVEATLALIVMLGFMVISILLAIRTFRLGALEFNSHLKIKSLLGRS